jgi:hypothetical protein
MVCVWPQKKGEGYLVSCRETNVKMSRRSAAAAASSSSSKHEGKYSGFSLSKINAASPFLNGKRNYMQGWATHTLLATLVLLRDVRNKQTCTVLPGVTLAKMKKSATALWSGPYLAAYPMIWTTINKGKVKNKFALVKNGLVVHDSVKPTLLACKRPMAIVYLILKNEDPVQPVEEEAHACVLLLDMRLHQAYFINPRGATGEWNIPEALIRSLQNWLSKNLGHKWTASDVGNEMCGGISGGLQALQDEENLELSKTQDDAGGWCAAWGLWFFHMHLLHPQMQPATLLENAAKWLLKAKREKRIPSLSAFIGGYGNILMNKALELIRSVSTGAGLTANNLFRDNKAAQKRLQNFLAMNSSALLVAAVRPHFGTKPKLVRVIRVVLKPKPKPVPIKRKRRRIIISDEN